MSDYDEQWEDIDEKELLVGILTELQQIRLLLSDADSAASDDADDQTEYRCAECQTVVPADARERHARETHRAPPDMGDSLFERVE